MHVEHIGHQHEKRYMLLLAGKMAISHKIVLKTYQPGAHLLILLLFGVQLPQGQP